MELPMFHIGQKVVCVNDFPSIPGRTCGFHLSGLTKGQIYTVRWVGFWGVPNFFAEAESVRLEEIFRGADPFCPDNQHFFDTPYYAQRFQPLIERKTDISIFTAMLTPSRAREPV